MMYNPPPRGPRVYFLVSAGSSPRLLSLSPFPPPFLSSGARQTVVIDGVGVLRLAYSVVQRGPGVERTAGTGRAKRMINTARPPPPGPLRHTDTPPRPPSSSFCLLSFVVVHTLLGITHIHRPATRLPLGRAGAGPQQPPPTQEAKPPARPSHRAAPAIPAQRTAVLAAEEAAGRPYFFPLTLATRLCRVVGCGKGEERHVSRATYRHEDTAAPSILFYSPCGCGG